MRNLTLLLFFAADALAQTPGERMLADYFRRQTARLAEHALSDIDSLEGWKAKREIYRRQFREMLGLEPLPEKGDLKATLTGKVESEKFIVEKIHFQSLPGLYVTANLYLPKDLKQPAPAILYLCGHARVFKDGVAYGNKANYQHHPAWFAENGYAAFIIDTLSLGEIEGEHHGTARRGWWGWPTRGYTPAGVETWNAIRALDYLATRPEVDMQRVGVTGRSGGGAYTWFLAAADERPSVLVPVAGITDMTNHVVDGSVEGHCDCMYQCNTAAWDFGLVAALSAPRPLLLANSDKDRIFPLDGVYRIHAQLKRIYRLHSAEDKLGLFISEGPHSDTQELQLAAFRWMNRWLKNDTGPAMQVATKRFAPEDLKVFKEIPADQINTRIHETFVPAARALSVPSSNQEWHRAAQTLMSVLRDQVFVQWPGALPALLPSKVISDMTRAGLRVRRIEYAPDDAYRLEAVLLTAGTRKPTVLDARVLDQNELNRWSSVIQRYSPELPPESLSAKGPGIDEAALRGRLFEGRATALILPRGVGNGAWPSQKDTHIRRRFLLLGQSLETMQVWDTRAALRALRALPDMRNVRFRLEGSRDMALVALFAAVFEDSIAELEMDAIPSTLAQGPAIPNLLRYLDLPQALALVLPRRITIRGSKPEIWDWAAKVSELAGGTIDFR